MKVLKRIAVALALLAIALVSTILVLAGRRYDAPYPDIKASSDPKVIERGRYLAYGPANCVNCHTAAAEEKAVQAGATPPLAGGYLFALPLGNIYTPNLTPDMETGIGPRTDAELARVIRHSVMADGRAALPFMDKQNLSDDDLTALISFLRSQPPVRRVVPKHEINLLGKAVQAFFIRPVGPSGPIPQSAPEEGTLEHGRYLATAVASCSECHTKRNMITGEFVGARFAGGNVMDDPRNEHLFVTPNLTPAKSGRITTWSEEQFVGRFGAGVGLPGSHMPWRQYQKMSEADVRAIYRFLNTLEPVEVDPGPSRIKRG